MTPRILTAPTFRQLEGRLLADLASACAENPFAPKWVIVPNATLANHLRARLAASEGEGALVGVRVANLPRLAERLAEGLLERPTRRWGVIHDLTLEGLVARLPASSPLARLREIPSGPGLLHEAFGDLAHGGFGIENLEKVRDLAKEDLKDRECALLLLFADFVETLDRRGIPWTPMALQLLPDAIREATEESLGALLGAEEGQAPRAFVHGFYEWLDVNLGWLGALSERVEMAVYYPFQREGKQEHPAFSFGAEILEDLERRMGGARAGAIEGTPGACGAFLLGTFPEGEIAEAPGFLTWQRASGPRAEAISAALRARAWIEDPSAPLDPGEILVTAPDAEGYADALREVFRDFALPLRVSDAPAGPVPEDEPRRMLAKIWEEGAPAEWVQALLRASPGAPVLEGVEVDAFEAKVRDRGIWGGEAWGVAASPACGESAPFTREEQRLLGEILAFAENRKAPTEEVPGKEAAAVFRRMAARWVSDPGPIGALAGEVEDALREAPDLQLELREWAGLLAGGDGGRTLRDPPSRSVLFAPVMRARGLTARGVIFLGLAAGQMPRRVEDPPLLSEKASERIAGAAAGIGHRLPVKSRLPEEMLLLFSLANSSAERIHWVVPETDATGRAVAPTPWVQRYLQRWGTCSDKVCAQRIPASPVLQAELLARLDPKKGTHLPPSLALYLQPDLAAACRGGADEAGLAESIDRRGRDPEWSGAIGAGWKREKVSVTELEKLALCPFRFRCEVIEGWTGLEPLSGGRGLDPLTRGILLHTVFEKALGVHVGKKPLGEIAGGMLARGAAPLEKLVREVARGEARVAFSLKALRGIFREAEIAGVFEMARSWFGFVADSGAVPTAIEEHARRPWPGLEPLLVSGKMDLVEKEGKREVVTDFKSGKKPFDYAKAVRLGWLIQAALYPWLSGKPDTGFRYLYLGEGEPKTGEGGGAGEGAALLGQLAPFVKEGFYPPTSVETLAELSRAEIGGCRSCGCASACRRFESGHAVRHAALIGKKAPARVEGVRAVVGEGGGR